MRLEKPWGLFQTLKKSLVHAEFHSSSLALHSKVWNLHQNHDIIFMLRIFNLCCGFSQPIFILGKHNKGTSSFQVKRFIQMVAVTDWYGWKNLSTWKEDDVLLQFVSLGMCMGCGANIPEACTRLLFTILFGAASWTFLWCLSKHNH